MTKMVATIATISTGQPTVSVAVGASGGAEGTALGANQMYTVKWGSPQPADFMYIAADGHVRWGSSEDIYRDSLRRNKKLLLTRKIK